jgi:hypothetical protein
VDVQVTFVTGDDGKVTELVVEQNGHNYKPKS